MTTEPQSQPDNWTRLSRTIGRLLGFILRLIFILLLAIGVGAGVYFGIPWLYSTIIEPVQNTDIQVEIVENRVDNLGDVFNESQTSQDKRLTELETSGDALREQVAAAETTASDLEGVQVNSDESRAALAAEIEALQNENADLAQENAALQVEVADLQIAMDVANERLINLGVAVVSTQEQFETERALQRVRSNLLQARLELNTENNGNARQLMSASVKDLNALLEASSALEAEERTALIGRISGAEDLLPTDLSVSLSELESAWAQIDRLLFPVEE